MNLIPRHEICSQWPFSGVKPTHGYVDDSNRCTVLVFPEHGPDNTPWEGTLRVGIKWHKIAGNPHSGTEIIRSWSWIQDIKDTLFPDRIAIEVYPPTGKIVDVAPMRWLWVLPDGAVLPFNLSCNDILES